MKTFALYIDKYFSTLTLTLDLHAVVKLYYRPVLHRPTSDAVKVSTSVNAIGITQGHLCFVVPFPYHNTYVRGTGQGLANALNTMTEVLFAKRTARFKLFWDDGSVVALGYRLAQPVLLRCYFSPSAMRSS